MTGKVSDQSHYRHGGSGESDRGVPGRGRRRRIGRPTLIFQAKEAVRLALEGVAAGVACDGCPPLPDLLTRYEKAGGRFMVCPVCFNAKHLDKSTLLPNAELAGSVQLWEWIGDEAATTFSY